MFKKIFSVTVILIVAIIFIFVNSLTESDVDNINANVSGFMDAVEEEADK